MQINPYFVQIRSIVNYILGLLKHVRSLPTLAALCKTISCWPHVFIEKSPYFVPVRMRRLPKRSPKCLQKFTSVDSVLGVRLDCYKLALQRHCALFCCCLPKSQAMWSIGTLDHHISDMDDGTRLEGKSDSDKWKMDKHKNP